MSCRNRLKHPKDLTEAWGLGFNVKAVKVIEESGKDDNDAALSASSKLTRLNKSKDLSEILFGNELREIRNDRSKYSS